MLFLNAPTFLFNTAVIGIVVLTVIVVSRPGLDEDRSVIGWWAAGDVAMILYRVVPLVQSGIVPNDPLGLAWVPAPAIATWVAFFVVTGLACHVKSLAVLCRIPLNGMRVLALLASPFLTVTALHVLPGLGGAWFWVMVPGLLLTMAQFMVVTSRLDGSRGLMILGAAKLVIAGFIGLAIYHGWRLGLAPPGAGLEATPFMPPFQGLMANFIDSLFCSFAVAVALQERQRAYIVWLSITDQLTGALNRRGALPLIEQALGHGARQQEPVGLAIIDIDHFKQINDRCGHEVGDQVLRAVAKLLAELKRANDILARWGGEEFLIVMPGTTPVGATNVLLRIREAMRRRLPVEAPCVVTFSAGVAGLFEAGGDQPKLDQLLARADARLYHAKRTRDCVVDASGEVQALEPA